MRNLISSFILLTTTAFTNEGMWQPHQLPELSEELTALGLQIDPENLSSLDKFPMTAVVSLGGCSASFVSPRGLVVTSHHHCVCGSIQFNSTPENNLWWKAIWLKAWQMSFLLLLELRVYVTEEVANVTDQVLAGVTEDMSGIERYKLIEANQKALIAEGESSGMHRCRVSPFHHGMEYYLIKRLEIRDVRLVYAPATSTENTVATSTIGNGRGTPATLPFTERMWVPMASRLISARTIPLTSQTAFWKSATELKMAIS